MDDVRGDFLGPPHGTAPAAVKKVGQPILTVMTHKSVLQSQKMNDQPEKYENILIECQDIRQNH